MIKIADLVKKYKTQNGIKVTAINHINLTLPKTGLIFILGKSGCGKSTLLNLLGGLDKPTSGDIIIEGQSSKKFSSRDFDSYRNAYVGFVFQDFNILDDLTVKENVAIAVRLQNRKITENDIKDVLNKVELGNLIDRNPNELSGGQKQRVAIARALIKNPHVILADEPTGALDSETGKKVLETLKELSRERLIVVASHDTDSAIEYADRIIKLSDGSVIEDTSPLDAFDAKSENMSASKPHIPLSYAFQISRSNFRKKKLKFAFSILLTAVSFSMFGVFTSLTTSNNNETLARVLKRTDYSAVPVLKRINNLKRIKNVFDSYGENTYEYTLGEVNSQDTLFTDKDISVLNAKKANVAGYFLPYGLDAIYCDSFIIDAPLNIYYGGENEKCFTGFCDCGEQYCEQNFEKILGEYPTTSDEIAISLYKAEGFLCSNDNDGKSQYQSLADLLGSTIQLTNKDGESVASVVISGIYKTNETPNKYNAIKEFPGYKDTNLVSEWNNFKKCSFMDIAFVNKDFYDEKIGYYDYDKAFMGTAKLESPVTLYTVFEQQPFAYKNPEHAYTISNTLPYSFFEKHKADYEIRDLSGNIMDDIAIKDDEILISADCKETTEKHRYEALIKDIKEFNSVTGYFSCPLKKYSKEAFNIFESQLFKEKLNSFNGYLNNYDSIQNYDSFLECYNYLEQQVSTYYSKLSERDIIYDAVNSLGYLNGEPVDEYADKLCNRFLTEQELDIYKTLCNELISCDLSADFFDFSENKWELLESLFKEHYSEIIGAYRALNYYWRLMPYSNAEQEFANVTNGREEALQIIKKINDKFNQNYEELCSGLLNDSISDQELQDMVHSLVILKENTIGVSKYLFNRFVDRHPYETIYDLQNHDKNLRLKTIASVCYKNQKIPGLIIANPNTLKKLGMKISEQAELYVTESNYQYTNQGKYIGLLAKGNYDSNVVESLNKSYVTYSLKTNDPVSLRLETSFEQINVLRMVSCIVGIVFAAFSSLLLFNFINNSIANKEKEIGIIRSLGASGTDVFIIFIIEALIMATISSIVANVFGFILTLLINKSLTSEMLGVSLFYYGFWPICIVFLSAFLISVLASLCPIVKICKKNTVDAIKKV